MLAPKASESSSAGDFVGDILQKRGKEVETMHTLAQLTKSGLDRRALAIVLDLIENGVDPDSIANVVQEIRLTAGQQQQGQREGSR